MQKLFYVKANAEVLNIGTSEYVRAHKIMGVEMHEYDMDPLYVSPDFYMITSIDGWVIVVADPGNQEPEYLFWEGGNGETYSVRFEDVEFEAFYSEM